MEVLSYEECNKIVREKAKLWSMLIYIQSWPYVSFKNRQKSPVFYLYICLLALNNYYVFKMSASSSAISAYFLSQVCTYLASIVYGYFKFRSNHPENYIEDFDEYFARDYNKLFICTDKNCNIVGCIAMTKPTAEHSSIELHRLRVDRKYRGTGLADRLMLRAEHLARSRGETRIELTVKSDQVAALKVYKRHGFQITREEHGHRNGLLLGINFTKTHLAKDLNQHNTS